MSTTVPELTSNPAAEDNTRLVWQSYATDMSHLFSDYMKGGSLVDTTLIAEGQKIRVHKMVLSACSSFLKKLLTEVTIDEPCIILPDEVSMDDLKLLIDFVYRGEIKFLISQISSLSKLAQMLGIPGLPGFTEVVFAQDDDGCNSDKANDKESWADVCSSEEGFDEDSVDPLDSKRDENSIKIPMEISDTEKCQKRPETKKVTSAYCSANLEEGFKLLQSGHSIAEASKISGVPRTTLYSKARNCGVICLRESTKKYSEEQIEQAVKAVINGQSLKNAAEMYGLSKTVLWRKSHMLNPPNKKKKPCYSMEQKLAALDALKSGEKTRKVSEDFGIPCATLYREKVKLMEGGRLPKDSIKKRTLDDILDRQIRVQQAVAACKEGKMSQSSAASHFEVPKTTIWRRLRSNSLAPVPRPMKLDLSSAISIAAAKETENDFSTFVIEGSNLKFVSEDDAMSMGSSHYIVLSGNEADSLPSNLQVMLPQNDGGVVCEVEDLAHGVDMETDCSVDVSEEAKPIISN